MIKDRKSHILGEKVAQSPDLSSDSPRMGFPKEDRADLFHNLVKASLEGAESLTDEELQGNIYIYLLCVFLIVSQLMFDFDTDITTLDHSTVRGMVRRSYSALRLVQTELTRF